MHGRNVGQSDLLLCDACSGCNRAEVQVTMHAMVLMGYLCDTELISNDRLTILLKTKIYSRERMYSYPLLYKTHVFFISEPLSELQ